MAGQSPKGRVAPKSKQASKKEAPKKSSPKVADKKVAVSSSKKAVSTKSASTKVSSNTAPKNIGKKSRQFVKPKSAAGALTQTEFLDNLKDFCGLEKRSEAKELLQNISDLLKEGLKKGYKIPLFGLGKIFVRKTDARKGRNPATGEEITIPAGKRIRFSATKMLKEML